MFSTAIQRDCERSAPWREQKSSAGDMYEGQRLTNRIVSIHVVALILNRLLENSQIFINLCNHTLTVATTRLTQKMLCI